MGSRERDHACRAGQASTNPERDRAEDHRGKERSRSSEAQARPVRRREGLEERAPRSDGKAQGSRRRDQQHGARVADRVGGHRGAVRGFARERRRGGGAAGGSGRRQHEVVFGYHRNAREGHRGGRQGPCRSARRDNGREVLGGYSRP